jgi:hypothetical protein
MIYVYLVQVTTGRNFYVTGASTFVLAPLHVCHQYRKIAYLYLQNS